MDNRENFSVGCSTNVLDSSSGSSTSYSTYNSGFSSSREFDEIERRRKTLYNLPNKKYLYNNGWCTSSGQGETTFYYDDGSRITVDNDYNIIKAEGIDIFELYHLIKPQHAVPVSVGCGHPIDFEVNKSYNKTNIIRLKGDSNMSLVGLYKCDDGIVGFGDYRSTKEASGFQAEEKDRDTQKVFKNNKFIMVTYGPNTIVKNGSIIKIEDYINTNLNKDTDYSAFFNDFANFTSLSLDRYNFIIGKKENGKYYIYDVKVSNGKVEYYVTSYPMLCGGDKKYWNIITNLYIDFTKSAEEIAIKIEKAMKALIDLFLVEDRLQTVGTNSKGEVLIEIFK